jgi:hypothetical protein
MFAERYDQVRLCDADMDTDAMEQDADSGAEPPKPRDRDIPVDQWDEEELNVVCRVLNSF